MYSPAWSRFRRLAMTGDQNPNYTRGHYTRDRRRLEEELALRLRQVHPSRLVERLARLPQAAREQAAGLLGWLTGDAHPEKWALADPRPGHPPRWYVPAVAIAFARAWLRRARELWRLVFFDRSSSTALSPGILRRGPRGSIPEPRRSAAEQIARLRAWSIAHGVAWTPPTEGSPG